MKNLLTAFFALLIGFAVGLAYAWKIAPVEYVDASPDLLRADFKDQYRIAIAASYASSHDLARARSRLELLSADPLGDVKAQAQRMVGSSENAANVELLVELASDLQKGIAQIPLTSTPKGSSTRAPILPSATIESTQTPAPTLIESTSTPIAQNESTPFTPAELTLTPQPTFTVTPNFGIPFILVGQETVCDPGFQPGLLQFRLIDSRRRPVPGAEIIVLSTEGEEHFFTGFKTEVGDGYADFVMKENISYNVRIGESGAFVNHLSAPTCTDPNGITSLGGLSLSFQQP